MTEVPTTHPGEYQVGSCVFLRFYLFFREGKVMNLVFRERSWPQVQIRESSS